MTAPVTQPLKDAPFRGAKGDSGGAKGDTGRLASLDAYRGFIMFLMASAGFGIAGKNGVAENFPGTFWEKIAIQVDHVPWVGCVLWDLIQPAFMFMVGVAAAYSTANRLKKGDSFALVLLHAAIRSIALVLLGVLLASNSRDETQTVWLFTNVLAQIGLGYFFVVLLSWTNAKVQAASIVAILVGYWLLFALWKPSTLPADADTSWINSTEYLSGFFAHWNPHTNAAAAFDVWFLNLFPRSAPYVLTRGGYQTLNFVPSLATMIMGLMTGELLRRDIRPQEKRNILMIAGISCLFAGLVAGFTVCPLVKRIWTPSWTLFSGGASILMLAAWYDTIDVKGWKFWYLPFTVIGMNSIFVYLGFQLSSSWIWNTAARHFGQEYYSEDYDFGMMFRRTTVLVVLWLLAAWLYRQKVFLRL